MGLLRKINEINGIKNERIELYEQISKTLFNYIRIEFVRGNTSKPATLQYYHPIHNAIA